MNPAPDFALPDQNGHRHTLADYAGMWLVLYTYPKDDTPGCTTEACAFRDAHKAIATLPGVRVAGVSTDSVESHRRFADKYHLTFDLLSDPGRSLISALGAWSVLGTKRCTFLINPAGQIVKAYRGVKPDDHVPEVLADLQQLTANQH
jgi:peroxiredoxin Q/BCP